MYRIKSKTLIQSSIIIGLITSINLHADSGLDKALNKHQKTFEDVYTHIEKQGGKYYFDFIPIKDIKLDESSLER